MSNDERKNKLIAVNKFLCGDLIDLLSPNECSILECFSESHLSLFSRARDWEWEIVQSIRAIAGNPKRHEIAEAKYQIYQGIRRDGYKRLRVDDLSNLLFPLINIDDGYFVQEVTEAIRDGVEDPVMLLNMESERWEELAVFDYPIHIKWLESRDSEYLRLCAEVWRGYLGKPEPPVKQPDSGVKSAPVALNTVREVPKSPEWEKMVLRKHKEKPALSHTKICEYLSLELGVNAETIRRKTTNPKPRKAKKS